MLQQILLTTHVEWPTLTQFQDTSVCTCAKTFLREISDHIQGICEEFVLFS